MNSGNYEITVSQSTEERDWDDFVEGHVDGHFEQSSLWARAKQNEGWRPLRIILRAGEEIVAGGQILVHRLPLIGGIGYMPKAPLVKVDDSVLARQAITAIKDVVRKHKIHLLLAQAPGDLPVVDEIMSTQGFLRENGLGVISATSRIDLSADQDVILSRMTRKWRYNFRLAQRNGVVVKQGNRENIGDFFHMMQDTCKRQGVEPNPSNQEFLVLLWEALAGRGNIRLFLAECNGELVSGLMGIAFGQTFYNWKVGWTGRYPNYRANQLLVYETIRWAKDNGYRYFDFVGISRSTVEAVLRGEDYQATAKGSDLFKLSFGGQVVLLPEARTLINNKFVNFCYRKLYPRLRLIRHRSNSFQSHFKHGIAGLKRSVKRHNSNETINESIS